jgi:hypothetical protein
LVNIANSNFLVHQAFVGDVYTINAKENRFGCFVATPMTAVKSGIGTIRYTYVLYYIDRLTKDEANIDFVQTDAVNLLKGVIEFLGENGVEIEGDYEFTLFRQKFDDWCAGAYVQVNILVPDNDCSEGIFNTDGIDLRPLVVDRNGIYEPGSFDGYNRVIINVPQVGATEAWVDDEIDLKLTGYATESYVGSEVSVAMDIIRGEIPSLEGYATTHWVETQGYLSSCNLDPYATKNWVTNLGYLSSCDLDPYATKNWVENQDYASTGLLSSYATKEWVSDQDYATKSWVSSQQFATETFVNTQISGVQSWVLSQSYITSNALIGYATESWVSNQISGVQSWVLSQSYITSNALIGYATESYVNTQISGVQSWVLSQSYITSNALVGYATESYVNTQISGVQSWVLSQSYITSAALNGYATESWVSSQISSKVNYTDIWTGSIDDWEDLTPEEQCSYLIALIIE